MDYNKVAAKWWADKLRNVEPDNFDNGDSSTGGMIQILATMVAWDLQPSSETIDFFEERLADTIKKEVETWGCITLYVDYHPAGILEDLAREANISEYSFPMKTSMRIEKDKVSVSAGYSAPYETIFPE